MQDTAARLNPFENQVYFHKFLSSKRSQGSEMSLNPFENQVYFHIWVVYAYDHDEDIRLNPFENQVYFHVVACTAAAAIGTIIVLIPL